MTKKVRWHDDETFWVDVAPELFPRAAFEVARSEADKIGRLTGVAPPAKVLDMCCGQGRHTIAFAKLGYQVTGVDLAEPYLKTALELAGKAKVEVQLQQADGREYKGDGTFDLAINLFTSFGLFEDDSENVAMARNMADALKPGGLAVFELMGREVLARDFHPRSWMESPQGFLLEHREISEDWAFVNMTWIVIRQGAQHIHRVRLHLYSGLELRVLLLQAGFEQVKLFGSLTGTPYDHRAQRLVALARKGG